MSFNEFCNENLWPGQYAGLIYEGDEWSIAGFTVGDIAHATVDITAGILTNFPATAGAGIAISWFHCCELMLEAANKYNSGEKTSAVAAFISSIITMAMLIPGPTSAAAIEAKLGLNNLVKAAQAWAAKRGATVAKVAQKAVKAAAGKAIDTGKEVFSKAYVEGWRKTLQLVQKVVNAVQTITATLYQKIKDLGLVDKVKSLLSGKDPITWLKGWFSALLTETNKFISLCYSMIDDPTGSVAFQTTDQVRPTLDPGAIQYSTNLPGYEQTPQQVAAMTA